MAGNNVNNGIFRAKKAIVEQTCHDNGFRAFGMRERFKSLHFGGSAGRIEGLFQNSLPS